ncbi:MULTISPECIES: AMP-binding protein [unclassified Novosphingobium]|uniref:AMP-binding protein n=1 Tax=unclassified Novosphingobium TaxID=2644732 RepID=UPI001494B477|nr:MULTISPECIES: AMP-binding protein [unclassified Novosphingobium]MBB3359875.1 acetyl-CoA synthetase [Novosphingobium sp. BK256]MBB3376234.1 acetyl-CoA synthetase [Novosphingobium sp. BK280]MBB3380648.1 acetyl-CoA synthetase [Novosphingobium sp. BK258]MBB3422356.1 acetyl-CoA synthetase [Novosphingobium sp. BK267]MBB3451056.1 acetyl-CoA synthetase [Novosphingobium sp. BK352]
MTGTPVAVAAPSYQGAVEEFCMEREWARLSGSLSGGINACVECCDRYADGDGLAFIAVAADGTRQDHGFARLRGLSAQVANMLAAHGVKPGDVVAGLLPRRAELIATVLGVWRAGAVYQPLFTAFGPKAIEHRLGMSKAVLVVTDSANRAKLTGIAQCPPVATVRLPEEFLTAGDIDFSAEVMEMPADFAPVMRAGDDLFLMMSTSGSTGLPKGVGVPLKALPAIGAYMRWAIDLRAEDRFWNIADPGWAYGLYYGITGPLLLGRSTILYEGAFSAAAAYDLIANLGVTNLAGSPTAYRLLMAEGGDAATRVRCRLRVVSSAGEPLNPEVIRWFDEHLAVPVYDHYGQTETGMVVNNHHGLSHPVRAGSAGFAMPGYRLAVLDEEGNERRANQPGELAVDIAQSPMLWFRGYWQQPTPAIRKGYYHTGDTVEREADGSISFIGRADDVITSSGYRIGPFDVESALIEHPAVMEAAVIGVPDPERTELVKALVVLNAGFAASPVLSDALKAHVRTRLSAHAYPRLIAFVPELPKTPSGKIQRFMLRAMHIDQR